MTKHKTFIILFILIGIALPLVFVFAQQLELEGQYPRLPGVESPTVSMGPAKYLKYIFVLGLAVSGLAAAAMIVAGGVMYMLAAGNESKTGEAKDRIFSAIGGLVLIIAAYLIIKTINPDLLTFREPNIKLPETGWKPPVTCDPICQTYDPDTKKCINIGEGLQCAVGDKKGVCLSGKCYDQPAAVTNCQGQPDFTFCQDSSGKRGLCRSNRCDVPSGTVQECNTPRTCTESRCAPSGQCDQGAPWNSDTCNCGTTIGF